MGELKEERTVDIISSVVQGSYIGLSLESGLRRELVSYGELIDGIETEHWTTGLV